MAKIQFNHSSAGQWLGCLTGLTLFACQSQGQDYEPDWTRNLRIGPIVGFNISASFSMKGNVNISANRPAGVYDDGYVRVDGTGNAEGYTSFWGYTDAAHQYNAASQTLTMHNATSYTLNSSPTAMPKTTTRPTLGWTWLTAASSSSGINCGLGGNLVSTGCPSRSPTAI